MIKRIKLLINDIRNTIQDGMEARLMAPVTISEALLKSQKPGLFHQDAKHRSKKLHKAILAGKAPRGRTA